MDVLNALPPELPETFGALHTKLMTLAQSKLETVNIREISSRGVHALVFDLDSDRGISLGIETLPACLNHTHEMCTIKAWRGGIDI